MKRPLPSTARTVESTLKIDLSELSTYSRWPAVLLGLEKCEPRVKSKSEVEREFELEKWGTLLAAIRQARPTWLLRDADECFLGKEATALSIGAGLYAGSLREVHTLFVDEIERRFAEFVPTKTIVELGAGYGSILLNLAKRPAFADARLFGAEYTAAGRSCLKLLAEAEGIDVTVGHCDFTSARVCELPIPPAAVIYTCMAVPYVPVLAPSFIDSILQLSPKVVLHIEPCVEHYDNSLLGQLRRKYTLVNDYNQNLMTLLRARQATGDIEILREEPCFFGENCLMPCSFIAWSPAA